MTELIQMKCVACRADSPRMTEADSLELKPQIPDWNFVTRDDIQRLEREFKFNNFIEALAFTNRVGALAEQEALRLGAALGAHGADRNRRRSNGPSQTGASAGNSRTNVRNSGTARRYRVKGAENPTLGLCRTARGRRSPRVSRAMPCSHQGNALMG